MRHLLAFFVLGAFLCGAKRTLIASSQPVRPQLVVTLPRGAGAAQRERAIDEAVLTAEALAHGGALIDPLVREQLLVDMREQGQSEPDERLIERALALGVHRADPVIRARLVYQAEQIVRAKAVIPAPSETELSAYVEAHRARYLEPARASFTHVFLSRSRRREQLTADAARLGKQLAGAPLAPADAKPRSDPSIFPVVVAQASAAELDARFGPGFGAAVLAAPLGAWTGPVSSSYGAHFVLVTERRAERVPPLAALGPRALADYEHDQRERALLRDTRALRARYELEFAEAP